MGKKAVPKKEKIKIKFVAVEGDVVEAVANALSGNVSSVLAKHGATLKISLSEIIRNHAKV